MIKFLQYTLIVILCVGIIGGVFIIVRDTKAQQATNRINIKKTKVTWTLPTTNVDGTPYDDHGMVELSLTKADGNPVTGGPFLATKQVFQETETLLDFPETLPNEPLKLWGRVIDRAGNASDWSEPLELVNDDVRPNTITIIIKIEVINN